ncbi:type II toxin-antitoxin system VapC family toxin [bacterium]|nr:type II toxin-antitoxin system VapC family toxin [bacterium]
MEKIILDTDIFIDYFRGVSEAESYIENLPIDKRGTTDVTLMELFSGARDKKNLATIVEFIETNSFFVFPVTASASKNATELVKKYTLSRGLRMPDALVAAIALSVGGTLVTGNKRHFEFIDALKVEIPPYRN